MEKEILFDLFDRYEDCEDILHELRLREDISNDTYNNILRNWDEYLAEWDRERGE